MPAITDNVKFDNIAREWRCKWATDADKVALTKAQELLDEVLVDLSSVEGVTSIQRIVCGGCHDFKVITKFPAAAFEKWEKSGFEPEKKFLAGLAKIKGISTVETQTFTLEEVKMNNKAIKKAQEKKEASKEEKKEEAAPKPVDPAKKKKAVIKEGGKRGVEIEGAADMGGLQFFCTSVDEPEGDVDLLTQSLSAMNHKSDPTEEERKGGSGHIGKMVFSAGLEQLAIAAYVPEAKWDELSCKEWLEKVLSLYPSGKILSEAKDVCTATIPTDGDKNVFPLKIREGLILEANNFLRKKGLFPDNDDDDDDEMVFGDDDFPS
jgi:hypothetical protein